MRAILSIVLAMLFTVFLVSEAVAGDQTFDFTGLTNNPALNVPPHNGIVESHSPGVVLGAAPPVSNPVPQGTIDPRTGQFLPGVAGGVINPQNGAFYPGVGGGYINPGTGVFIPHIGR